MKRTIIFILLAVFFSCATKNAIYIPIEDETTMTSMSNGTLDAIIENESFRMNVNYRERLSEDSIIFIVSIRNWSKDEIIKIRLSDFKIIYTDGKGIQQIENCLTEEEYYEKFFYSAFYWPYQNAISRNHVRETYFKDNDIMVAGRRDFVLGLLSFPDIETEEFILRITINKESVLRPLNAANKIINSEEYNIRFKQQD
jgi:hypothetical protein